MKSFMIGFILLSGCSIPEITEARWERQFLTSMGGGSLLISRGTSGLVGDDAQNYRLSITEGGRLIGGTMIFQRALSPERALYSTPVEEFSKARQTLTIKGGEVTMEDTQYPGRLFTFDLTP